MSSYNVGAKQAKLFGFSPKYVWDEFTIEHTATAREIKKRTFALFMDIEDKEGAIQVVAAKVLADARINVDVFARDISLKRAAEKEKRMVEAAKRARERFRQSALESLAATPSAGTPSAGERSTPSAWSNTSSWTGVAGQCKQEISRPVADVDDGEEAIEVVECGGCARKDVELEALRRELRACQAERDLWRGRYMALAKDGTSKKRGVLEDDGDSE